MSYRFKNKNSSLSLPFGKITAQNLTDELAEKVIKYKPDLAVLFIKEDQKKEHGKESKKEHKSPVSSAEKSASKTK